MSDTQSSDTQSSRPYCLSPVMYGYTRKRCKIFINNEMKRIYSSLTSQMVQQNQVYGA